MKYLFSLVVFALLSQQALAQVSILDTEMTRGTQLQQILDSVQEHYPLIKAAQAEINGKDALVQAAQGAFDPVLDGSFKNRLSGFYDGNNMESFYRKRFPAFGAQVYAGFRRSDGSFPTYENELTTTNDGESRVGVSFSLWRDRDFDEYRFQSATSRVDALKERYQLQKDLIWILQDAYITYAQWLQAARLLDDYTELLQIAVDRADAVNRSVESGNTAEIIAVDNNLAVLQRRSLVVDAQRLVDASAYKLSLFYRNTDGSPRLPVYTSGLSIPEENIEDTTNMTAILDRVIQLNPDIAMARLNRDQEELEVRLANNEAKPRIDLRFYNARDFGGGITALRGTENVADISFSIPLATNTARGKASAARSRITSLNFRIQQFINQTQTDLEVALVNLDATRELENIAEQELDAALQLADAEARRFEAGLSDFFQLNLREQVVAEAELKRWRAHFDHQVALANYYGVSMDLQSLGLDIEQLNLQQEL